MGRRTLGTMGNGGAGKLHDPISYEVISECSDYIKARSKHRPKIGIICGSGLDPYIGGLADLAKDADIFPYSDIPGFPQSTVAGHVGRLLLGELDGVAVVIMQGRFHSYEGYELWKMLRELGVDSVGMSTIPETIAAHHCGMKVFACSLITNMCVVEYGTGIDTNHDEVIEVGKRRANDMKDFIAKMVVAISKNPEVPLHEAETGLDGRKMSYFEL